MLQQLISRFKHWLILPTAYDSEFRHRVSLLQISFLLATIAAFISASINLLTETYPQAISLFGLSIISVIALALLQRGNLRLTSHLMPAAMLAVLTYNLYQGGGIRDAGVAGYPLILIFANLLLGRRAAFIYAGLGIGSVLMVSQAEFAGRIASGHSEPLEWIAPTTAVVLILSTAVLLWVLMENLEHNLARAQSSEAHWRAFVASAPVWIIHTNLAGDIQFTNRQKPGRQQAKLLGSNMLSLVPGDQQAHVQQQIDQVVNGGGGTPFELDGRTLGRAQATFSVSIGAIHSAAGSVEGLSFILVDITEQKKAEEAMLNMNTALELRVHERTTQLETAIKELETFSYSISHDLRTPLRAIDGFSQLVLEDYYDQLDEVGKDYLRRVRSATQRMGLLLDELVELFRLVLTELEYQPVDLSALAEQILQNLQASDPSRPVQCMVTPGLATVGDQRLLRLALEHLLGNAWKFTAHRTPAEISFGQYRLDNAWVYFVQDNGIGFNMQYAGKLFNAFQSLHKPGEYPGSAIGLAIVQRIIHKHGGRVWGEGWEDQGAIFNFTLAQNES